MNTVSNSAAKRSLIALLIAVITVTAGIAIWQTIEIRRTEQSDEPASRQSVLTVAVSTTKALLSYTPANVEMHLTSNYQLLTGEFRDSYTDLTRDVVIPGAKEKDITATAEVPAAGVESITAARAVVIAFINQTVTVGTEPAKDTASTVRIGMRKVNDRWLIESFEPL